MSLQPLNARTALELSTKKRWAARSAISDAQLLKANGDNVAMVAALDAARAFIQSARDLYEYAMRTGSLSHHYVRTGGGLWHARLDVDGMCAWLSARRYAQRQSAQRAAGKAMAQWVTA
jgi:hypothetical protein